MRRHGNHQGIYQVPAKVRNFSFVLSQLRLIKNLQTVARNILSDKVRKTRFGRTDCPMDTRQLSSLVEAQRGPPARVWEDFTEAGGPSSGGKWGWREQESSINLRGYALLPNLSLTQLWRRGVHTKSLAIQTKVWKLPLDAFFIFLKSLSRVRLFVTPWTVAHQASPSMGFSRQEYWSGLPFPSPGGSSPPRD